MDFYNIFIVGFFIIVIIGISKGCGENRKIIIFQDYDDLALTFFVPASFVLIIYVLNMFGVNTNISIILGGIISLWLLIISIRNTYINNSKQPLNTVLALITKIPLGVIWILALIETLNPSGKGIQRKKNRGNSLIILTLLTPIINMLVVEKSGNLFNPKNIINKRRVGTTVRDEM